MEPKYPADRDYDLNVEMFGQRVPTFVRRLDDLAGAVEAQNHRPPGEAHEHEGDAAVLHDVGRGLVAAAGQVQIYDAVPVEHAKGVHAFRRGVHPAVDRSGRDDEQALVFDELTHLGVDFVIKIGHLPLPSRLKRRLL